MHNSHNQRYGYTLVELLVTIAIIIVLAAISSSLSSKAISSAKGATCSNRMRELSLAHITLAQENNGLLIQTWNTKAFGSWKRNWSQYHTISAHEDLGWRSGGALVNPKMRNLEYLQCPVAYSLKEKELKELSDHNGWRTYGLNQKLGVLDSESQEQNQWIDGAKSVSQVQDPSKLVLFVERAWSAGKYPAGCGPTVPSDSTGLFAGHGGFTHVAYFDGHVERKRPERVPIIGATLENGEVVGNLQDPEVSLTWRGIPPK